MPCRGIGPHLSASGKSDGFLEVQREAGVCSRVTAGEDIKNLFVQRRQDSYLVTMDTSGI